MCFLIFSDEVLEDEKDFVILSKMDQEEEEEEDRSLEGSRKRRAPSVGDTTPHKKIHTSANNVLLES